MLLNKLIIYWTVITVEFNHLIIGHCFNCMDSNEIDNVIMIYFISTAKHLNNSPQIFGNVFNLIKDINDFLKGE